MQKITASLVVFLVLACSVEASQKPKRKRDAEPSPNVLTLARLELGQTGVLAFPPSPGGPITLLPLEVGDVQDGQFVGSLTSSLSGKTTSVVVRGVNTKGLISGRYYQLDGVVRVADTTDIGDDVFVLEPVNPESFALKRSESPELERPR